MQTSPIEHGARTGAAKRLLAVMLLSLIASVQAQPAPQSGSVPTPGSASPQSSSVPMPGHAGPQPLVSPPLPAVPGALSWEVLGQVKPVRVKGKLLPEFSAAVIKLDRQEVKVAGFMLPLQSSERQNHFLLTVTSQTCSFCVPAGPEGIIEVRTRTPVRVTFDPVLIAGRLEVLRDDPTGVYYRISNGEALPIR